MLVINAAQLKPNNVYSY